MRLRPRQPLKPIPAVRYSAQKIDETFVENDRPWRVSWSLTITAEDRGLTSGCAGASEPALSCAKPWQRLHNVVRFSARFEPPLLRATI